MSVRTTYFSAIANGDVEPAQDDVVFGVVRRPADWIFDHDVVDRNIPALAPPEELLDAFKRVESAAEEDEHPEPSGVSWRSVDFEYRYLGYLDSPGPQQVIETILERASDGRVWLVCWEADETHCHRRLLARRLRDRLHGDETPSLDDACASGEHDVVPDPRVPNTRVCAECRLSTQTLVDYLDHDLGGESV